jgi:WD40 repeat protein
MLPGTRPAETSTPRRCVFATAYPKDQTMPIRLTCPSCGKKLRAKDEHAGRRVLCPGCGKEVTVAGESVPAYDVFISYSSKDKPVADAACATLEQEGFRCWIAPRDIVAGEGWSESIIKGIEQSRLMTLVFSAHANASRQVIREVERAVAKGIPIIPFRVENLAPSRAMEYFISSQHWLDAYTPPLEQHMGQLARTVDALLKGGDVPHRPGARADAASYLKGAVKSLFARDRRPRVLLALAGLLVLAALALAGVFWAFREPKASPEAVRAKADAEMMWGEVKDLRPPMPPDLLNPADYRPEQAEIETQLRRAQTSFGQKDFRQALAGFRDVIAQGQKLKDRNRLELARGNFRGHADVDWLKRRNPGAGQQVEGLVTAAEAAAREGRYDEAAGKYEEARRLFAEKQSEPVPDSKPPVVADGPGTMKGPKELAVFKTEFAELDYQVHVALSPEGRTLAAAGREIGQRVIHLWEPATGKERHSWPRDNGVDTVQFSPDGRLLIDDRLTVYDTVSAEVTRPPEDYGVHSFAVAPDGKRAAVGLSAGDNTEAKVLRLVNLPELKETASAFETFEGQLQALAYSPDGARLAAFLWEKGGHKLLLLDPKTGAEQSKLEELPAESSLRKGRIPLMDFSQDGNSLATYGEYGRTGHRMTLWDLATGKARKTYGTRVWDIKFIAGGQLMAVLHDKPDFGDMGLEAFVYDVATGDLRWRTNLQLEGTADVLCAARGLLAAGRTTGEVILWDLANNRLAARFKAHAGPVVRIAFSPEGKFMATFGKENKLKVWSLE